MSVILFERKLDGKSRLTAAKPRKHALDQLQTEFERHLIGPWLHPSLRLPAEAAENDEGD